MEIIKVDKYKVQCPCCKAKLTFKLKEIDFEDKPFHRGGFIKCPVCSREIQTHERSPIDNTLRVLPLIDAEYETSATDLQPKTPETSSNNPRRHFKQEPLAK